MCLLICVRKPVCPAKDLYCTASKDVLFVDTQEVSEVDATTLLVQLGLTILASISPIDPDRVEIVPLANLLDPRPLVRSFSGDKPGVKEELLDTLSNNTLSFLYDLWSRVPAVAAVEICNYVEKRLIS